MKINIKLLSTLVLLIGLMNFNGLVNAALSGDNDIAFRKALDVAAIVQTPMPGEIYTFTKL